MPCSGGYPPDDYEVLSGFRNQLDQMNDKLSFYRNEADKLTDILYRMLNIISVERIELPEDIKCWWEAHKKLDEGRK